MTPVRDTLTHVLDRKQVVFDSFLTTENREVTGSTPVGATAASPGFYWGGGFFVNGPDLLSVSEGVSHREKPEHTTHAACRRPRARALTSARSLTIRAVTGSAAIPSADLAARMSSTVYRTSVTPSSRRMRRFLSGPSCVLAASKASSVGASSIGRSSVADIWGRGLSVCRCS